MLVDGKGQRAGRFDTTARIVSLDECGDFAFTRLDLSQAYPILESYQRTVFLFRPDLVVVFDDLTASSAVTTSWLLHTLSPPAPDSGCVRVIREPASLEVRLFTEPDDLAFSFTDRHGVDPNEGVPEHLHRHQPTQYHLTWQAGEARSRRFLAVMAVNGAGTRVAREGSHVVVGYGDQNLRIELDAEADEVGEVNGRPLH